MIIMESFVNKHDKVSIAPGKQSPVPPGSPLTQSPEIGGSSSSRLGECDIKVEQQLNELHAQTIDLIGRQVGNNKLREKFRFGDHLQKTPSKKDQSTKRFDIFTPGRTFDSKIIGFSSTLDLEDFFPSPPSSPPLSPPWQVWNNFL